MRRFINLSLLLISFFALCLTSCNNSAVGSFTGGDKQPLTINILTEDGLAIFNPSAAGRSIIPDAINLKGDIADDQAGTDLRFYIWGQSSTGAQLKPKEVTVIPDNKTTGKIILDIDCYNWDLTLVACDGEQTTGDSANIDTIKANAILIGYANVDMNFTNTIQFTLTPKGLKKQGNANITISRNWNLPSVGADGYKETIGIYTLNTHKTIEGGTDAETTNPPDAANPVTKEFKTYTEDSAPADGSIAAGTYLFEVKYKKAGEKREYVYNDTIVILPGRTTTRTIEIPDFIGAIPDDVDDFTFKGYTDNDETEVLGYYPVTLYFDELKEVKTEKNFAIEILEIAAETPDSEITSDNWDTETTGLAAKATRKYTFDYNALSNGETLDHEEFYDRFFLDGSLNANSTSITLNFELGKRYVARIKAENDAGKSENYTYLKAIDASTAGPNGSTGDTVNDLYIINRYKVTYHLQQGTWVDSSTEETNDIVEYRSRNDAVYTITDPIGEDDGSGNKIGSDAHPLLTSGGLPWFYWTKSLGGPAVGTNEHPEAIDSAYVSGNYTDGNEPELYKAYDNLDLYAVYKNQGGVNVYDDSKYDLKPSMIEGFGITYSTGADPDDPDDDTGILMNKRIDFSKASGTDGKTTISITAPAPVAPATTAWCYDKVLFELKLSGRTYYAEQKAGAAAGTANTFEIPLANLPNGVYFAKITAHYKKTVVSYPFTVSITD